MTTFYQESDHTIHCGHALDISGQMPDESVDMVITSPPYWGLRTYKTEPIIWGENHCEHEWGDALAGAGKNNDQTAGPIQRCNIGSIDRDNRPTSNFCLKCNAWRGELGLEPTIELYIQHLILIFNEVKRVLKKTGTCFVNIDDSYAGSGSPGGDFRDGKGGDDYLRPYNRKGLPAKSLCLIPQRFAIAMVEQGWILRNDIVWNKPNPMPESVKDRFSGSWEHLFFFVKSKKYWFEQQFEPQQETSLLRAMRGWDGSTDRDYPNGPQSHIDRYFNKTKEQIDKLRELGRNKRDVWEINTQPYPEAHFATFPEKLCETPILAGCPSMICKKCGKAREKIYDFETIWRKRPNEHVSYQGDTLYGQPNQKKAGALAIDKGYTDCGCNAGFEPGIVLDPFTGSGTAQAVAKRLGRKSRGIDLNPNYCKLAAKRLQEIPMAMPLLAT